MPSPPCSWPVDRTVLPSLPTISDPPEDGQQAAYDAALAFQFGMEDLAVNILWQLTGRQFGICETTVRPCANERQPTDLYLTVGQYFGGYSNVVLDGGLFGLLGCGCGSGQCNLSGPSAVHLAGPVVPPTQAYPVTVTIHRDGAQVELVQGVDFAVEGDVLYRTQNRPWPYQNYARPMGEQGTWLVTYWRGTPPPYAAGRFVGILTAELMKASDGDKCRLPKSVTRVSRQGASFDLDPTELYATGKTGIPEIDTWLAAVNPNHLQQAPSVL